MIIRNMVALTLCPVLLSLPIAAYTFDEGCAWDSERQFQAVSALKEVIAADKKFADWDFDLSNSIEDYDYRQINEVCVIPLFPTGPEPEIFGALFNHESGVLIGIEIITGLFDDCTDEVGDAEIIEILQTFTPLGLDAYEAIGQAISRFGKNGPGLLNKIDLVDGKWELGGRASTPNGPPDGKFAATFLLVEDHETPLACTTHIYGTWIFDDQHTLLEIQIGRSHGPMDEGE